jgi:type 1 glutamine amidotransferase
LNYMQPISIRCGLAQLRQLFTASFIAALIMCAWASSGMPFKIMVFSKTAAFRHASITNGIEAIRQLGTNNSFDVVATENSSDFNDANLAQFAAVIFLSTTGDVLDATQQSSFEGYIRAGGGYVGIHSASDTEYTWPWYGGLVGAYFSSHPSIQKATVLTENWDHPSTRFLSETWVRTDEWYNFQSNPRNNVHVLCRLDESSYNGGTMGDHPISWFHDYDGGRAWYTASGHTPESFAEPLFRTHLLGGIQYAANALSSPPPGALVLFDGHDGSQWTSATNGIGLPWQVTNGTLTALPGSGNIRTFQLFEDYQLHLEFLIPPSAPGTAENALGNSGVYLQDQFEIQILDSYGRPISGANETGAIFGQRNPTANVALPAGTWETLEINFHAPRWNGGAKIANARASVSWNGVLVQDNVEISSPTTAGAPPETPPPGHVQLQALVGTVQFRNIWLLPGAVASRGIALELVPAGSSWRFLDDGSAPIAQWRSNDFVDNTWGLGRAQLGYGDGDEATVVRANRTDGTRIITTYFRKYFSATNTAAMTNLQLRVLRDDGAIVYLNGIEAFHSNMPNGPVDTNTLAVTTIGNEQEFQWVSTNLNPALLVEGTNLLAVEIHQSVATSTDISFDLALWAVRFDSPAISVAQTNSQIFFNWAALPPGFQLESKAALTPTEWTPVPNIVTTVPGVRKSVTVANPGSGQVFYRLRKN